MTLFDAKENKDWQSYLANQNQDSTDDAHTKQLEWYTNDYMIKPGVWGDHVIIYAFTQLYDIDVTVYTAGVDEPYTIAAREGTEERKTAKLGYIPHLHFVSMVDKKDSSEPRHALGVNIHDRVSVNSYARGDCLFESLADQLFLLTSFRMEKHEIREHLVTFIRMHPKQPNGDHVMMLFDGSANEVWQKYTATHNQVTTNDDFYTTQLVWYTTKYMVDPNVWGDSVILYAFAQLYGIDVVVYTAGMDKPYTMKADEGYSNDQDRKKATLGHVPHSHFVSLVEEKDGIKRGLTLNETKDGVDKKRTLLKDFIHETKKYRDLKHKQDSDVRIIAKKCDTSERANDEDKNDGVTATGKTEPTDIVEHSDSEEDTRGSLQQRLEQDSEKLKKLLKEHGSQSIQGALNRKKDAASDSVGQTLQKMIDEFESDDTKRDPTRENVTKTDTGQTLQKKIDEFESNDTKRDSTHENVTKTDSIRQLRELLKILVKQEKKTVVEAKKDTVDYIPENCGDEEATHAMYELGKQITACDQNTELTKQARLMVELAEMYTYLANKTKDGWHFVWAAALYNAALQRIERTNSPVEYDNELFSRHAIDALQQLETDFLKAVSKINKESTEDCTKRYKKVLNDIRKYSNDRVNDIHTNDMQVDSETLDMSIDNELRTISRSKIYYDELTGKIKEFHRLLINDCISVLGKPNCKFAWLGLGSLARKEATAWSDLESAIIYDPEGKTSEEIYELKQYFRVLVHYLHLKVINLGETLLNGLDIPVLKDWNCKLPNGVKDNDFRDEVTPQGLCFDGTQPKASKIPLGRKSTKSPNKTPSFELIMTLSEMADCQFEHVSIKEGYHLSDVLLTSTIIYGDESLWEKYNDMVHEIILSQSSSKPELSISKERGIETLHEDLENYFKNPLLPKSFNRELRTKHTIYRFATISINILKSLYHCVKVAPLDILEELQEKHILTERAKIDLQVMVCIATNIRHLVYGRFGRQHETISFSIQPSGNCEDLSKMMSVRDYLAIFRFYGTLIPWSDFLLYHYCFDNMLTCAHESEYKKLTNKTNAELQKEMHMYQGAIRSLDREKYDISQNAESNIGKIHEIEQNISRLYGSLAMYSKSIKHADASLAILGDNPNVDQSSAAISLNRLGIAYQSKGEYDRAIQYHEECLTMMRLIHGNHPHQDIASSLNNIGNAYESKGEYDRAIQYHEESLAMKRLIHGNHSHPDVASSLGNIGIAYQSKGEYDRAIQYHEESLAMYRLIYGNRPHPHIASVLGNIGNAFDLKGDTNKALHYLLPGLYMEKEIYGDNPHDSIAYSLHNIGTVYVKTHQYSEALELFNEAYDMLKKIHGNNPHPVFKTVLLAINQTEEQLIRCAFIKNVSSAFSNPK